MTIQKELEGTGREIRIRGYSGKTIKVYLGGLKNLFLGWRKS